MRKTSLDLRREIIDVGGIQNLIELRKKRKQKKRDALAAAQEPPPEPEEIVRALIWTDVGREPGWPRSILLVSVGECSLCRLALWMRRHS